MTPFWDSLGKSARTVIGISVVLMSFGFLFALLWVKIPKENETIVNVATGLVLSALGGVVAYYFGSSKDKSDQDKVINANTLNQP